MPTPLTLDPQNAPLPTLLFAVPTAVLVALLYRTTIVLPLIDTGLLNSAVPIPTPLTPDPQTADQPFGRTMLMAVAITSL